MRTALNVRDKSRMKEVLQAAGIPCARHALVRNAGAGHWPSPTQVGFPLVAKPPDGAGAQSTFRLDDGDMLRGWLAARAAGRGLPRAARGVPHRRGAHLRQRHRRRVDRVVVDRRLPPAAAGGPAQPVDPVDGRAAPRHHRPAVRGHPPVGTGGAEGARASPTRSRTWSGSPAPTARSPSRRWPPGRPGAQLTSMHGYAHDFDLYRAWAELVDPRPVRRARAPVRRRDGLPARPWGTGGCARCTASRRSSSRSGTWSSRRGCRSRASRPPVDYLGEGYAIVRDPDTAVVEDALHRHRRRGPRRAGRGLTRRSAMNIVMLSPGYPAEMAYFTRALAGGGRPGHRGRRPAAARAARGRPRRRSRTTST